MSKKKLGTNEIQDKEEYISLAKASEFSPYSQDYLSLRARQGKLKAVKLGRNWATKKEWVENYATSMGEYREELDNKIEENDGERARFKNKKIGQTKKIEEQEKELIQNDVLIQKNILPQNIEASARAIIPASKEKGFKFAIVTGLTFLVLLSSVVFGQEALPGKNKQLDIFDAKVIKVFQPIVKALDNGFADINLAFNYLFFAGENKAGLIYEQGIFQETANIFGSYFNWAKEKVGQLFFSDLQTVENFDDANKILIDDAKLDAIDLSQRLETLRKILSKNDLTETDILILKQEIDTLKTSGVKTEEIIGEVQQITRIYPKEIIERRIEVLDEGSKETLAVLKKQIEALGDWEDDIANLQKITSKLKATPNTIYHSSAPVYIESQGLQVGGHGTFASLGVTGAGSVNNLGVGDSATIGSESADNMTVYATSQFFSPVDISANFTAGSSDQLTIDTSGNITTSGNIITAGNATVSGSLTVIGNLTQTGTTTFNGVSYIWPGVDGNNTQLLQTDGSGNLVWATSTSGYWTQTGSDIYYTSGNIGIGTTSPNTSLHVVGTSTLDVITEATWQGNTMAIQYGGTGQNWNAVTKGSIPYFSSTGAMVTLATSTDAYVLTLSGGLPTWAVSAGGGGSDTDWIISGTDMYATSSITRIGIGTSSPNTSLHVIGTSTLDVITGATWQGNVITDTYIASSTEYLADTNTTYSATGTLMQLTGTSFGLKEGILTNGKFCAYDTVNGLVCNSDAGATLTQEQVEDFAGLMVATTTGTHTLITITYDDVDGNMDFVVDNNLANYDNTNSDFFDTAGTGLTSSDNTINFSSTGLTWAGNAIDISDYTNLATSTGISLTGDTLGIILGEIDHDQLLNFAANEHFLQSAITQVGTIATGTWEGNAIGNTYIPNDITIDLATLATTLTIADNESTNENNAILFTSGGSLEGGDLGIESDGTMYYNPSTGKITATGFVGALTGNADTVSGFTPASGSLTLSGDDILTITTTGVTNSTLPLGTKTLVATDVATLSSLTSIGTIATGTWESTDIGVSYGGTGISDPTDHSVLVGSGAGAMTVLAAGTNGQILVGSTDADPVFAALTCGDDISCTIGAGTLEIDVDDVWWDSLTDMTLTDNYIYVGDGSNDPVGVAMSNDCTIDSDGVITCDHDALANFASNEHFLQSAITQVGTIATGTWEGTDIGVTHGGTGKSVWTQYLIPYADSTTSFSQIAIGSAGQVLTSQGAGAAAIFEALSIAAGEYAAASIDGDDIASSLAGTHLTWNAASPDNMSVSDDFILNTTDTMTGNLSIGTTTTNARLTVQSTSTTDILNLFETGGTEVFTVLESGNVGIGTTSPSSKLHVFGSGTIDLLNIMASSSVSALFVSDIGNVGIGTTTPTDARLVIDNCGGGNCFSAEGGTGKIDVGTIDPIYRIGDISYATYVASMTGVMEETSGIIVLQSTQEPGLFTYIIDFDEVAEGTDVWLFKKIVDMGQDMELLVVLLSSENNTEVSYQKDSLNNRLIIYGDKTSEVSYRFIY